jgi:hypothetical protein
MIRAVLFNADDWFPILHFFYPNPTYSVQYLLYTVMVFNEWHNGIHVAFIIANRCVEEDILRWLTSLQDRVV